MVVTEIYNISPADREFPVGKWRCKQKGTQGPEGGKQGPSLSDKCRGQWPSPPRETLVDFFKQMSEVRGSEWPMIGIRPLHRTLIVGSNLRIVPAPALAPAPAPSPVFTQSPASAPVPAYAPAS